MTSILGKAAREGDILRTAKMGERNSKEHEGHRTGLRSEGAVVERFG